MYPGEPPSTEHGVMKAGWELALEWRRGIEMERWSAVVICTMYACNAELKWVKIWSFCWDIARTWVFLTLHTTPSKTWKSSGKVLFNRKCKQYAQNTQQQPGHTSYQNRLERHMALTSLSLNLTSHLFPSTCTKENLFHTQRPTVGCCAVDSSFREARQAWDKILTYPSQTCTWTWNNIFQLHRVWKIHRMPQENRQEMF